MLSGLLYFHRISDNRMAGTPLKNLRMFEELCGKNAFHNVILTTTMWDDVEEEVGEEREKELITNYWRAMLERDSTTSRFLRTRESAFDIIEPLIEAANKRSSVLLQDELVNMRRSLPATAAGRELFSTMGQLVAQREDLIRRIRQEMRQSGGDKMFLEPLQEEHQKLQKSLEETVYEMRRLRLPLGKRLMITTDKFFSTKFESLKSFISKRRSRPATHNSNSESSSSFDSGSNAPVSPVDHEHNPTGVISNDPIDYPPKVPYGWTPHNPDNTVSPYPSRTPYPTQYGSSPVSAYPTSSYDRSQTPNIALSPSDPTLYTIPQGSSPAVQPNVNYNRANTTKPPEHYGQYSQSNQYSSWPQNPNNGYQG